MIICYMLIIFFVCIIPLVYGDISYDCNISVGAETIPIYYDGYIRENPDGTFYPGDGFHYIFKYTGSDSCTSFTIHQIESSGAIHVTSHNITQYNSLQNHSHKNYEIVTKYLTTTHYYKDKINHCRNNPDCQSVVLAEYPSYSILEGQPIPSGLQKLLDGLRTASTYDIRTEETQDWGLTKGITDHTHEDKHPLEDDSSIIQFDELISTECSNLEMNQGCVYGHAEIAVTAKEQICLLEELERLKIDTTDINNECIDNPNNLSLTVTGNKKVWGTTDTGKPVLELVKVSKTTSATPSILDSTFDVLFEYPALLDLDALPAMNNDGTYYADDPAAVIRYTDFKYAQERWPSITFSESYTISDGTQINDRFTHDCNNTTCIINATYYKIHDNEISYSNGWGIDVWDIDDVDNLGKYFIQYSMTVYNLGEKLYTDTSDASLLFVVYDPAISEINTWPRLADAGHSSVDDRYAIAVQYDGSFGGGPDDIDDIIHQKRRMKITDVYNTSMMSNGIDTILSWSSNNIISQVDNIDTMKISQSVSDTIPDWFSFSSSNYTGSLVVSPLYNNTAMVFYEAGYARFLQENDIPSEPLDRNYSEITMHDTLMSDNFAGLNSTILAYSEYAFPFGFFSIPYNVTAYKFLLDDMICEEGYLCIENVTSAIMDEQVMIYAIDINGKDTINDDIFTISTTEFFLNNHNMNNVTEPFTYMLLSDLFEMNPPIILSQYGSSEIILNKTGMSFNLNLYNEFAKDIIYNTNYTFADMLNVTDSITYDGMLHQSSVSFFSGPSSYDVTITAQLDSMVDDIADSIINNTIHYEDIPFKYPINHKINMYPDNYLLATRGTNIIVIDNNPYFGNNYETYLDGEIVPKTNSQSPSVSCNESCVVLVPDDSPAEIALVNIWGGISSGMVEASLQLRYPMSIADSAERMCEMVL